MDLLIKIKHESARYGFRKSVFWVLFCIAINRESHEKFCQQTGNAVRDCTSCGLPTATYCYELLLLYITTDLSVHVPTDVPVSTPLPRKNYELLLLLAWYLVPSTISFYFCCRMCWSGFVMSTCTKVYSHARIAAIELDELYLTGNILAALMI